MHTTRVAHASVSALHEVLGRTAQLFHAILRLALQVFSLGSQDGLRLGLCAELRRVLGQIDFLARDNWLRTFQLAV